MGIFTELDILHAMLSTAWSLASTPTAYTALILPLYAVVTFLQGLERAHMGMFPEPGILHASLSTKGFLQHDVHSHQGSLCCGML
jgi:hypothetical protein